MKRTNHFMRALAVLLMLVVTLTCLPVQTEAATKLNINLKNNQIFYMLPGTDQLTYKVTATGNIVGAMRCSSNNLPVASIDDFGNLSLKDAGSAKITVSFGAKSLTRTITVLKRTDWTKVISIKNQNKIPVKENVCTINIKNEMDFPIKTTLQYHLIADSGSTVSYNQKTTEIVLPAKGSLNYKMVTPDQITYVAVDDASFSYQQFGLKSINAKKLKITESTKKNDSKTKVITESIVNKNKNGLILPYHLYLYDKNGKLLDVEYHTISVSGKQKTSLSYTCTTKDKMQDSYVAKVQYKFEKPIPFF